MTNALANPQPAKSLTCGTAPLKPSYATFSQADIAEAVTDGRLTVRALSQDLSASKSYWVDTADALQIAAAYRLLKSVKGVGDVAEAELEYIIRTFVADAQRNQLSQGELEDGMQCYRDHGGPFLPRTFGEWRQAQEGHVFLTGRERHERYAERARQIQDDVSARSQRTVKAVDLMDEARRDDDVAKLFHLARRHSARCSYYLPGLPCVLSDLDRQARKVQLVPASSRTTREVEVLSYAERISRRKPKSNRKEKV